MATRSRLLHEPTGTRHPDALFIDLLLPDVYRSYLARPERLLDAVAGHRGERTVVIDEVQRKTVEGYLSVMEDLLLCYQLPVYRTLAKRTLSAHGKLCIFDAGVFRALRPRGAMGRPEEAEGQALEGLVAQHLAAWIVYGARGDTLSFWRTRSGLEVDFVVHGDDGAVAIEVKNARRVHRTDLRGLLAFREDHPETRCLLLYRGSERLEMEGIACVPCEEFLRSVVPGRRLGEG